MTTNKSGLLYLFLLFGEQTYSNILLLDKLTNEKQLQVFTGTAFVD